MTDWPPLEDVGRVIVAMGTSWPGSAPPVEIGPGWCPECGAKLVRRDGKYGKFVGCAGYPDCRYTRNL